MVNYHLSQWLHSSADWEVIIPVMLQEADIKSLERTGNRSADKERRNGEA